MKQIVYGLVSVLLVVIAIVVWLSVEQRASREAEMEAALQQAVNDTVEQMAMEGKYTVGTEEEVVADFTSMLVERLHVQDRGLSLAVGIAGVDAKKGFLSVHVEEKYTHPNGKVGTYETTATIALEQEEGKAVYEVCYVIPLDICQSAEETGEPLPTVYKSYVLEHGTKGMAPSNPPDIGGKKFLAWADENGTTYTKNQLEELNVEQAMIFTAIYG